MQLNTFSVAARCVTTGQLGVAVATAVPAVGAICPYVRAGTGAVSSQSWVNPLLAFDCLAAIETGLTAHEALNRALENDAARSLRQIGVVDAQGRSAAWSGADCTGWFGHRTGPNYAIQGNMLAGPHVIDAMVATFESTAGQPLDERLMRCLEDGDRAGGDKRGKQSAALCIHEHERYAVLDIRVDEHRDPVTELRRVLEIARVQLVPFVRGMPKQGMAADKVPDEVVQLLALAPAARPGPTNNRK